MLTVGDLMTRDVVTLEETDDLVRVDDLLKLHHIRHLPVVREGRLVGLVSHRDLIRALSRQLAAPHPEPISVSRLMSRDVEMVRPDLPVREAIYKLLDQRFGCLPVVDRERRLVGIITEADFMRMAARLLTAAEARRGDATEAAAH
ncbi:CBS domain-containing protein [Myxococcus sp. K38C18041901]|uniref:CBS domain-containing protein n=1 Tax=Myxococcus guangdongensis TaxID=2906760 RepID=UPI0020A7B7F7|nr:CBS domain-containing protein [Myxococcus guangdongensis]MCP3058066.1 CBS domain-containing protein [Myxococcus guangdongensis]